MLFNLFVGTWGLLYQKSMINKKFNLEKKQSKIVNKKISVIRPFIYY
jgi:hypothetical protein